MKNIFQMKNLYNQMMNIKIREEQNVKEDLNL